MNNLDIINLTKVDPSGMYHDIANSGLNFFEGWQACQKLPIPPHYIKCRRLVITGMGGSGLAGWLIKDLITPLTRIPIEVINNYLLPGYVDNETVVIAISNSGNTEETIEGYIDAYKKGARLISIGTGGKLEDLSRKYGVPFYRASSPTCGEPRLNTIKFFGAILSLVNRLGYFEISNQEILQARDLLTNSIAHKWSLATLKENNQAKKLATASFDKIPVIWGADHLVSVAHRFKADYNENAKTLSYFEPLPEMDHKSLVGSDFPKPLIKNVLHLFLKSKFGYKHNQIRIVKTADIFHKKRFPIEIIEFEEATTPLAETILGLTLSCFISFYLAILYGEDPTPVKVVEEFKKSLK